MDGQVTRNTVPSQAHGAARLRRVEGGRQHVVKVKLDEAEYAAIAGRAADLKISIQRYFVSSAFNSRSPAQPARVPSSMAAELAGLRRLTANLANNINQIARALNSGATPAVSIPAAADAVRRVMIRLDSVLAGLGADGPVRPAERSGRGPSGRGSFRTAVPPARSIPEMPP
jgi:hypothetical protein